MANYKIHSSRVHNPLGSYPEYVKGSITVPGREPVVIPPDGGPDFPFAQEYPAYLHTELVSVHGDHLFHNQAPHWVINPAL